MEIILFKDMTTFIPQHHVCLPWNDSYSVNYTYLVQEFQTFLDTKKHIFINSF